MLGNAAIAAHDAISPVVGRAGVLLAKRSGGGVQALGKECHALLRGVVHAQIRSYDVLVLGQGFKRKGRESRCLHIGSMNANIAAYIRKCKLSSRAGRDRV